MKDLLHDFSSLFLARRCPVCGQTLSAPREFMCASCRIGMPLTGYAARYDNPVRMKFGGLIPLVNACSYFHYIDKSGYRKMIHALKYNGKFGIGKVLGNWFGTEIREGGLYTDLDLIVPVPLHWRKKIMRGYNQSEFIARGISQATGIPFNSGNLKRVRHNPSQAKRSRSERWENVTGLFTVSKPGKFDGKHILLVDDVLTTGATVVSCAEAILKSCNDVRISIAVLASKDGRP